MYKMFQLATRHNNPS